MTDTPRDGDAEHRKDRATIKKLRQERDGLMAQVRNLSGFNNTISRQLDSRDAALSERDARIAQLIAHAERQAADITARNKLLFPDDDNEDPEANELARARTRYLECDAALREAREEIERLRLNQPIIGVQLCGTCGYSKKSGGTCYYCAGVKKGRVEKRKDITGELAQLRAVAQAARKTQDRRYPLLSAVDEIIGEALAALPAPQPNREEGEHPAECHCDACIYQEAQGIGRAAERAAIVAATRDCPEPIVNAMMEERVKWVGRHMADQIRAMLHVFGEAIERGEHAGRESGK